MKALLRVLAVATLAVVVGGIGLSWWARRPLLPANAAAREVTVAPGSSVRSIGTQYETAGVPVNPWLFMALARIERRATRLQAGTYLVDATATPQSLIDRMQSGDVVKLTLVVPEGWTFAQMKAAIAARADVRQTVGQMSEADLMRELGASNARAEGLFFPDTYVFTRGTTDLELYRRAHRMLAKRLDDAWAARASDLPLTTPYEALTLASIVEKETGRPEDRPQVAAVFINRLRRGMLLQTDPAVIYGMGARFDGNLRKADLVADTPYNTYVRAGLPPTPIALVGSASLAAVLNPPRSEALYFVARGDGSTVFSPSLVEHNRAVDRFQRDAARADAKSGAAAHAKSSAAVAAGGSAP